MTRPQVYDPLGLEGDALPAPGTDEGWAALAAEAARNGYPDPQSYVAAYQAGEVNVGFAGYQPGNPHTGFGQLQAYDHAAGEAGIPIGEYASLHTPEALAAARGEDGGEDVPAEPAPAGPSPFTPPANFTADGRPIEYDASGQPIVFRDDIVYFRAPSLPEGVDHYDRYTGEPLDAQGHVVPGVPNAGEGYEFTSALDQRVALDEHGRIDPDEVERLEAEAREHGRDTVADDVAGTTRPFPGHPLSDTGEFARPVPAPGQPPLVYSGPDGSYVITSAGTVLTAGPGADLSYEGEDGSVVIDGSGRVTAVDGDGNPIDVLRGEPEFGDRVYDAPGPVPEPREPGDLDLDGISLRPEYDDFPDLVDTDGDGIVDSVAPKTGDDGFVTNEYRHPPGEGPDLGADTDVDAWEPDPDPGQVAPEGSFGTGHEPGTTTVGGGFAQGADDDAARLQEAYEDRSGNVLADSDDSDRDDDTGAFDDDLSDHSSDHGSAEQDDPGSENSASSDSGSDDSGSDEPAGLGHAG
ncbi:hypothetical protein WCD74_16820 [Actinomycetospora sp. OC33-EN08]|uniref:OCRE domain-containing protein n=1 Tax=Actinomycetospora aurantiaca TaxID=3129233 RepID=A0ABU8MQK7_9PSEU